MSSRDWRGLVEGQTDAFLSVREVADKLQVPKHRIRFWESKFRQIRPLRLGGNRRYYLPKDVAAFVAIHYLLNVECYTIRGAQKKLREVGRGQLQYLTAEHQEANIS